MRVTWYRTLLLMALTALTVFGWAQYERSPSRIRWEYQIIYPSGPSSYEILENLNKLGAEGWELCLFVPERTASSSYRGYYFFKRPR
jgi:hypothetical protein